MAGALILIVEDNPKNLKLIRDILQFRGYTTLEAETGEAGVTLARERQPALILMDVQLPGMDGRAATKALKADPSTRKIPSHRHDGVCHEGGQGKFIGRWLRRLYFEADQYERSPQAHRGYLDGQL